MEIPLEEHLADIDPLVTGNVVLVDLRRFYIMNYTGYFLLIFLYLTSMVSHSPSSSHSGVPKFVGLP